MVLVYRLLQALFTVGRPGDWLIAASLLLLSALLVLPVGIRSGFLRLRAAPVDKRTALTAALLGFVTPAFTEELLFRALLLPHPQEAATLAMRWLWNLVGLAVFVLYHPLKAPLVSAERRAVYRNPIFLWMATVVGVACAISYAISGSIWPSVALHGIVVAAWLLRFGGWSMLQLEDRL